MRINAAFALLTLGALAVTAVPLAAADGNPDPFALHLVTEDVPRFWQAFDASAKEGAAAYDRLYIQPGSPGLQDFVPDRIESGKHLFEMVHKHRAYYELLRTLTLDPNRFSKQIRASFFALKYLYPEAKYPDVYFVIGAMNSGGTSAKNALIIGLDLYGKAPGLPADLEDWAKKALKPIDEVPYIVAHELIHFQQSEAPNRTLLAQSLTEGSADYIGELISGNQINVLAHTYGDSHEAELWAEFQKVMNGRDLNGWLYSGMPGRPNDLGYYMGYKITESYIRNATDKRKAIEDTMKAALDPTGYLARSHYQPTAGSARR
jgi:hypothetical protein